MNSNSTLLYLYACMYAHQKYEKNIKRKKLAIETAIISVVMLFALASNIQGHNIQIAIAAKKKSSGNSAAITTITAAATSSTSDPNQTSSPSVASSSSFA